MQMRFTLAAGALALLAAAGPAAAEVSQEMVVLHSAAIAGNPEGNSPDRVVAVFLPATYASEPGRHYPVIYFLHGYSGHAEGYDGFAGIAEAMEEAGSEVILVIPDGHSKHGGSMYAASPTTGDFESFVAREVVAYVDSHYRTIARREARGLAGHSMGGYGALKLAMKHPQNYGSVYSMSACCLNLPELSDARIAELSAMSEEEVEGGTNQVRVSHAWAAAWSPAPDKPPYYFEWPASPEVRARWAANSPIAMLPQYAAALKTLDGIGLEVGDRDQGLANSESMDRELTRFAIAHDYAIFEGGHFDRIRDRVKQGLLPFFARHLAPAQD